MLANLILVTRNLAMLIILLCMNKLCQVIKHLLNLKLEPESGLLIVRMFLARITPIIGQKKYF